MINKAILFAACALIIISCTGCSKKEESTAAQSSRFNYTISPFDWQDIAKKIYIRSADGVQPTTLLNVRVK